MEAVDVGTRIAREGGDALGKTVEIVAAAKHLQHQAEMRFEEPGGVADATASGVLDQAGPAERPRDAHIDGQGDPLGTDSFDPALDGAMVEAHLGDDEGGVFGLGQEKLFEGGVVDLRMAFGIAGYS